MTDVAKILRDLRAGQTTASSMAGRLGIHQEVVEGICLRLVKDGKAETYKLYNHPHILIFRLTNYTNQNELLTRNPTESAEPLFELGASPPPSVDP